MLIGSSPSGELAPRTPVARHFHAGADMESPSFRRFAWPGRSALPPVATDPIAHLLACHARIRDHLALAKRLIGPEGAASSPSEVAAAGSALSRYFGVALPLHVADEEESLRPRLAGATELAPILEQLGDEHVAIEGVLGAVVPRFTLVGAEPARLGELTAVRDELGRLETLLEAHLALEETRLFPALEGLLPAAARAEILAEQRARRQ
jgi:hypothetical protein